MGGQSRLSGEISALRWLEVLYINVLNAHQPENWLTDHNESVSVWWAFDNLQRP